MWMVTPFTDIWNTNVGELAIDVEVSVGHSSGNVSQAVDYICLKFGKEVWAEVIDLGVASI